MPPLMKFPGHPCCQQILMPVILWRSPSPVMGELARGPLRPPGSPGVEEISKLSSSTGFPPGCHRSDPPA